ncbi:SHOCT domain-containing protein [Methanoculleus sp. FWC-SCC1]|uniref:SHOCT domain-containing protein n=1 Tax=Methanoculleus frigidifontis TaxID=2584085 RepID=A0ABT8M8W2_9EURY|nr:SHOCT domain-containing protein [Methanoculleus sp. FWC-SCC1]MDN7024365.1 SHOCT domain-containing protein [Methanoculleus sp. FWC-SCC1]
MRGRGLALAAGYRMGQRQAEEQRAPEEAYRQQPAQAAAPPKEDVIAQIEKLSELHQSGALTDEEYAAAKRKLLE